MYALKQQNLLRAVYDKNSLLHFIHYKPLKLSLKYAVDAPRHFRFLCEITHLQLIHGRPI